MSYAVGLTTPRACSPRVEVTRTARRLGGHAPAVAVGVLAGLRLLAIEPIVPAAAQIGGTYDQRMISEAHSACRTSSRRTRIADAIDPEALGVEVGDLAIREIPELAERADEDLRRSAR